MVDLRLDDDQEMDLITADIGLHSTAVVAGNTIIVGAALSSGEEPKYKTNVKGYVRGFDARTGKRLWIFHTIPKPQEFGYNTWENGAADYTGNTGVWAQISVDEKLGLAYLPVEFPLVIITVVTGPVKACSQKALWQSILRLVKGNGTINLFTTESGILTSRARQSWWISLWMENQSGLLLRQQSSQYSTSSIVKMGTDMAHR